MKYRGVNPTTKAFFALNWPQKRLTETYVGNHLTTDIRV